VNNVVEADNVLVLQLLHQGDLTDCCRGCAFFRIEVDFLECYQLSGLSIAAFEDLVQSAQTIKIDNKITRTKGALYNCMPSEPPSTAIYYRLVHVP
jgi:hypothetical protein